MTTSKRDYRFDLLRLILILMVAVYHMLSYYGSNYVDIQQGGFRSFLVQNFLWAGGRMACNVFLFISAWFLVDKKSNRKKILDIWITVLTYSIIIGIFFFIKTKDIFSLIRHFIPILSNQVWYVTSYISVLFVVPLLNTILEHCDLMQQKKATLVIFIFCSIVRSFYVSSALYSLNSFGWFCLCYLLIGIIKKEKITLQWYVTLPIFALGQLFTLLLYNYYDNLAAKYPSVISFLGIVKNQYFGNIASLPCFLSSIGLFMFFVSMPSESTLMLSAPQNEVISFLSKIGAKILQVISKTSLDIYIITSFMAPAPNSLSLAWVEMVRSTLGDPITPICKIHPLIWLYILVLLEITLSAILGLIRLKLTNTLKRKFKLPKWT